MADRTSAGLFASIFGILAERPDDRAKEIARRIWPLRGEYDFNDYQMGCDEELLVLGLAKLGEHPDYPGEEIILCLDEDGSFANTC